MSVTAMTYAGHSYQLPHAISLLTPSWGNVGIVKAGNDAVQTFTDASATGSGWFYRIVVTP